MSPIAPTPDSTADAAASATIGGEVFVDFDRDGRPDRGERALEPSEGVEVRITDTSGEMLQATSGSDGTFSVEVDPATAPYRIEFATPDGYLPPFAQPIDVRDGESRTLPPTSRIAAASDSLWFGIVPPSNCPDDPVDVGLPTERFPDGNAHSSAGKIWTTCFVDGSSTSQVGAQDVLVGANYDASGWSPADGREFGGNIDAEHLATKQQTGAIWGIAQDEWDGWLFTSAVVKRHSAFGPEGIDGLYWLDVDDTDGAPEISSVSLDSITPDEAPSFGSDPSVCPSDLAVFDRAQTGRGGLWDCRDVDSVDAGGDSYDWWAFDRTGRDGIGDIDTTPSGDELLVMNATADTLIVYDISDLSAELAPEYVAHYPIENPGCSNDEFEAWGVSSIDAASAYIGVTCTASSSNDVADLDSHVIRLEFESATQASVATVSHDHPRGAGYTVDAGPVGGRFQPWLAPATPGGPPSYPVLEDASKIGFRDFLDAYSYSNAWDWHQPLLSDIEIDPLDGSLVVGITDRWAMMTGLFDCDLDPTVGGCGAEIPAPPPGDYDGEPGNDAVAGYTAPITAYVAGDVLRFCDIATDSESEFVPEGSDGCVPPVESPQFVEPFGGGPAGDVEWFWGDQAFGDSTTESPHPETAQGALFIGQRHADTVFTAMNPTTTFGAGWARVDTTTGTPIDGFHLFRTDFEDSDGTGWKGSTLGDVEGCSVPIEIGRAVWFDNDRDGERDPEDFGIAGVRVGLIADGEQIAETFTEDNGIFYFGTLDGLAARSDYRLTFDLDTAPNLEDISSNLLPNQLVPTLPDSIDDDQLDSDAQRSDTGEVFVDVTTGEPGANDHTIGVGYIIDRDASEAGSSDDDDRRGAPSLETFLMIGAGVLIFGFFGSAILKRFWGKPTD